MTKQINLTQGKVAIVDDSDYEWLSQYKWRFYGSGYAVRDVIIDGVNEIIYMHKAILDCPDNAIGDHKDRDKLNNQRSNLRVATFTQNSINSLREKNKAGYRGVSRQSDSDTYKAQIKVNKVIVYLGSFREPIDAALAYDEAAIKYHGEYAITNFPRQGL